MQSLSLSSKPFSLAKKRKGSGNGSMVRVAGGYTETPGNPDCSPAPVSEQNPSPSSISNGAILGLSGILNGESCLSIWRTSRLFFNVLAKSEKDVGCCAKMVQGEACLRANRRKGSPLNGMDGRDSSWRKKDWKKEKMEQEQRRKSKVKRLPRARGVRESFRGG